MLFTHLFLPSTHHCYFFVINFLQMFLTPASAIAWPVLEYIDSGIITKPTMEAWDEDGITLYRI